MTKIKRLVLASIFTALAFVAELVIHIKVGGFLTYDAKDAILTIGALVYGPLYGAVSTLIVSIIEFFTVSTTGIWGLIMNFVSSATFVLATSLIYKKWRTIKGALVGLSLSIVLMTLVMLGLNLVITPIYTGMSMESVAQMIPTLLLPFNFVKAISNAAIVLALYKPVISALRAAKIVEGGEKMTFNTKTIIVLVSGAIILCAGIVIMIKVL